MNNLIQELETCLNDMILEKTYKAPDPAEWEELCEEKAKIDECEQKALQVRENIKRCDRMTEEAREKLSRTKFWEKRTRINLQKQIKDMNLLQLKNTLWIDSVLDEYGFSCPEELNEQRKQLEERMNDWMEKDSFHFKKLLDGSSWTFSFDKIKATYACISDEDAVALIPDILTLFEQVSRNIEQMDLPAGEKDELYLELSKRKKELGYEEREREVRGKRN